MKKIFLTLLLFCSAMSYAQDLSDIRLLLQKGENSESAARTLIAKSKENYDQTKKPIYEAFFAIGHLLMAKHVGNPVSKYSYFNKGKKLLDNAVNKDPNNLEIRFLRYHTQEEAPAYLGYNKDLKSDKNFILTHYKNSKDQELVTRIKKHLKL